MGRASPKVRDQGDAVALSPAFRETLDRHGALMKQAASFRRRPLVFERLLSERAGIGQGEIEELPQSARARRQVPAGPCRPGPPTGRGRTHQQRQDAERQDASCHDAPRDEAQIAEAAAAGIAVPAADPVPDESLSPRTSDAAAPGPDARGPARLAGRSTGSCSATGTILSSAPKNPICRWCLMYGYDALIHRVRALGDHPDLSERARGVIDELLAYHDDETVARETAEGYLAAAERHVEAYKALEHHAGERGLPVARLDAWPQWREAAEMLAATGKAVLGDDDRYGAWLDAMTIGRERRASYGRAAE